MNTTDEIKRRLWNGAEQLRGSMDASRYKDYMLGLMFYKFLSDKTLEAFKIAAGIDSNNSNELYKEYYLASKEFGTELYEMIQSLLGYYVLPEYLYQTWLNDIDEGEFEVQKITDSLNNFERTIGTNEDLGDFKGLFSSSTLDLSDTALGSNLNERSKNIQELIKLFSDLDMVALQKGDVLGDAYEYLIGQFAMESGKKAGEFYTPRQVSEVMAQIVAKTPNIKSIYDATVGSGSLLLTVGKHLEKDVSENLHYYGQEKNTATYNLTRMNLLLHSVRPEKMTIRNADTLGPDWPEDPAKPNEGVLFDAVVMNPPYSVKNWNRNNITVSDPRFELGGELPPSSKGDYAFLLHGLYHLSHQGTMAIVLPHGVLFRGGSEGTIRQRLLEKNYIDTVIGLPSNMFTNTGIPVVVIILKKNRSLREPVLIIDSSKNFAKEGKQNVLREKDIARIVDTQSQRLEIEGFSYLATLQEIKENDFNLNIPRYVSSNEIDIPHDVDAHLYGGIPANNIEDLKVLNDIAKDTLWKSFTKLREGYYNLNTSKDELMNEITSEDNYLNKFNKLEKLIDSYLDKYWQEIKKITDKSNIKELKSDMLSDIKDILSEFKYLEEYDGYQIIADIWKNSLQEDLEIISLNGFYESARNIKPNMVIKGSGNTRRTEQDGWLGLLIPNELIENNLFKQERENIEAKKSRIREIDSELEELAEAAKVEDSEEYDALNDYLKRDAEDEPTNSFDLPALRRELKNKSFEKESYTLISKVDKLSSEKTSVNSEIRSEERTLREEVEKSFSHLSNQQIDELMHEKWFGNSKELLMNLLSDPLRKELDTLDELNNRYSETIDQLDEQISDLEKELEKLMSQLVKTNE